MAGCFGNSLVDRQLENELFKYLDRLEEDESEDEEE